MACRLRGFDYSRPYYYMVTLGRPLQHYVEGLMAALSRAYWEVAAKEGDIIVAGLTAQPPKTKRLTSYAH